MVLQNEKPKQAGRCRIASLTIGACCRYRGRRPIEPSQCPGRNFPTASQSSPTSPTFNCATIAERIRGSKFLFS